MENKTNILNMQDLEGLNQEFENLEFRQLIIEVGKKSVSYDIGFYKYVSDVRVSEIFTELLFNMDNARKKTRNFGSSIDVYLMYLIIKHTTTLGETMHKEFKEQLTSLNHMVNTGVYFKIINLFEPETLASVQGRLEKMLQNLEKNVEGFVVDKEKYSGEVYHKDLVQNVYEKYLLEKEEEIENEEEI